MGTYGIGFLSLFLSLPHILLYCTSRHVSTESFIQCRIAPYSSSRSPPFTAAQQRDRHPTGWQQPTAGAEAASNRQFVHERTLTRHSNHGERRTKKKERKKKRKERETERERKEGERQLLDFFGVIACVHQSVSNFLATIFKVLFTHIEHILLLKPLLTDKERERRERRPTCL